MVIIHKRLFEILCNQTAAWGQKTPLFRNKTMMKQSNFEE